MDTWWFVSDISRSTQLFVWAESLVRVWEAIVNSLHVPYCGSLSSFPWNDISVTHTGHSVPYPKHKLSNSWLGQSWQEIWLCILREISLSFWTARPQRWCNLGLFKVVFRGHMMSSAIAVKKTDEMRSKKESQEHPALLLQSQIRVKIPVIKVKITSPPLYISFSWRGLSMLASKKGWKNKIYL